MMSKLIAGGVALVVLVALIGVVVGQGRSVERLKEERTALTLRAGQAEIELAAKRKEALELRAAHESCMNEIRTAQDDQLAAHHAIEQLEEMSKRSDADVQAEREAIASQPGCHDIVTTDLALGCPDLARSLRRRAAEMSSARRD